MSVVRGHAYESMQQKEVGSKAALRDSNTWLVIGFFLILFVPLIIAQETVFPFTHQNGTVENYVVENDSPTQLPEGLIRVVPIVSPIEEIAEVNDTNDSGLILIDPIIEPEPIVEEPIEEEPVEEPVIEEPVVEEPVEEPVIEEPIVEEPINETPEIEPEPVNETEPIVNLPPTWQDIPAQTATQGIAHDVNLNEYASDPDSSLTFSADPVRNVVISISEEIATITPDETYEGNTSIIFTAHDQEFSVDSGIMLLTTIPRLSVSNISERLDQLTAEVGKPVRWRKRVVYRNEHDIESDIAIDLPVPEEAVLVNVQEEQPLGIASGRVAVANAQRLDSRITERFQAGEEKEYVIEYETPGPEQFEEEIGDARAKRVTVSSEYHYVNVATSADIPESRVPLRLFHFIDGNRIDVTDMAEYSVRYEDTDSNGLDDKMYWTVPHLSDQEFEIGLATVNTKKSIYKPNEDAELIMVVLDDGGYLVSGADVTLVVTAPDATETTHTTQTAAIIETSNGIYETTHDDTSQEGNYTLEITAISDNVNSTLQSYFTVMENFAYDIVRDAPATIDPFINTLDVDITITSLEGEDTFSFTEVLPIEFTLLDHGSASVTNDSEHHYLTWDDVDSGDVVSYSALAPQITPSLWELGPSIVDDGDFVEARPWLLAIDPIASNNHSVITATLFDATDEYNGGPSVVFINRTHGYVFYVLSAGIINYQTTTNGGANWSGETAISPDNNWANVAVWYDQWTPFNTTGTNIYLAGIGAQQDDAKFKMLDTTDNSLTPTGTTWTTVRSVGNTYAPATDGAVSITKSTENFLYLLSYTNSEIAVHLSVDGGSGWSDTSMTATGTDTDFGQILPLEDGDVMVINEDISEPAIEYDIYEADTNGWGGSWTAITTDWTVQANADLPWGTVVDPNTGNLYWTGSNNAWRQATDLLVFMFNITDRNWYQMTDVLSSEYAIIDVKPFYNPTTNELFAVYLEGYGGAGDAPIYKRSPDNGSTWSVSGPLLHVEPPDDTRTVRTNFVNNETFYVVWYDDDSNDLFGNIAPMEPINGSDPFRIDPNLHDATDEYNPSPNVYFVNESYGYVFYIDSSGDRPRYRFTEDGGQTWTQVDAGVADRDWLSVAVWHDEWTEGYDGTRLHFVSNNAGQDDIEYRWLDTSDNTFRSDWIDVIAGATITPAADGGPSVTRSREGDLFVLGFTDGAGYVYKSEANGDSWSDTSITADIASTDFGQLIALPNGSVMLILHDITATDLQSKVYNNETDTWDATWTTIDSSFTASATYDSQFSATFSNMHDLVFLTGNNNPGNAAADIATYVYNMSDSQWYRTADIKTDNALTLGAAPAVDELTGDVYVVYLEGNALLNDVGTFFRSSSDNMSTWGDEQGLGADSDDNKFVRTNYMSTYRLFGMWYNDDLNDIYGGTMHIPRVDTIPPNVTLHTPPNATFTNSTTVNFTYHVTTNDNIANCTLWHNDGGWGQQANNATELVNDTINGISQAMSGDGSYNWIVNCFDQQVRDSNNGFAPFNFTITVDTTEPVAEFIDVVPNPANQSQNNITINWTAHDLYLDTAFINVTYPNGSELGIYTTNITLNTSQVPVEGNYTVVLYSNDSAANVNTSNVTIVVSDVTPPNVSLFSPPDNSYTSDTTVQFLFNVSDSAALANCTLDLNGGQSRTNNQSEVLKNETNNITLGLFSATFIWSVDCRENSDNALVGQSSNRTIIIDASAPSLEYISPTPSNNAFVTDDFFFINVSHSENNPEIMLFYVNDSINNSRIYTQGSDKFTNLSVPVEDGHYNFSIFANDSAQNSATLTTRTVIVDTTTPTIDYIPNTQSNNTNQTTNSFSVNVSHTESNPASVSFYLNSGLQLNRSYTGTYSNITFTSLSDGTYTYFVTVNDSVGNENSTLTRLVRIDGTAPSLTLQSPDNDTWQVQSDLTFAYTTSDNLLGVSGCSLVLDDVVNQTNSSVTESISLNFSTYMESTTGREWYVNCSDSIGNQNVSETRTIKVDTTFPQMNSETANQTTVNINSHVCINITVTDSFSDVASVIAEVDKPTSGLVNFTMTNTSSCGSAGDNHYAVEILSNEGGNYTWGKTYVTDNAGNINITVPPVPLPNWSASSVIFTESTILAPTANITVNESDASQTFTYVHQCYAACRDDSSSPCENVFIKPQYDPSVWSDITTATTNLSSNVSSLACGDLGIGVSCNATFLITTDTLAGANDFPIRCFANSSNAPVSFSDAYNVTVNDHPTAAFTNPSADPANLGGTVTLDFSATVEDRGVADYRVILDSAVNFASPTELCSGPGTTCSFNTGNQTQCVEQTNDCYLRLNVTDIHGLKNSTVINIKIDNAVPFITLNAPDNDSWENTVRINFTYSGEDDDLDVCTLYHNGTGTFVANETNTSVTTGAVDFFDVEMPEGSLDWNVLCTDTSGNARFNNTNYTLHIDRTPPQVNYSLETPLNGSAFQRDYIYVEINVSEPFESNVTFTISNVSGQVASQLLAAGTRSYNFTNLAVGEYLFNATVRDLAGNLNTTPSRFSVVDQIRPELEFNGGTAANNSHFNRDWVFLNVSLRDDNFANITYSLYDATGTLVNQTVYLSTFTNRNFSVQDLNEQYSYNATARDQANNVNITETRIITLDNIFPVVELESPADNAASGTNTQTFSFTPTDTNIDSCSLYANFSGSYTSVVSNNSLTSGVENFFAAFSVATGSYVWSVQCADYAGNTAFNSTNRTIDVDVTLPAIFYLDVPANDTQTTNRTPTFNWSQSSDTHFHNYTLRIFDDPALTSVVFNTSLLSATTTTFDLPSANQLADNTRYYWQVIAYDTFYNGRPSNTSYYYTTDSIAPIITLEDPANNTEETSTSFVTFAYNLTDDYSIANCTLVLNDAPTADEFNVSKNVSVSFVQSLSNTQYFWNITCYDFAGNQNTSEMYNLSVDVPFPVLPIPIMNYRDSTSATFPKYRTFQDDQFGSETNALDQGTSANYWYVQDSNRVRDEYILAIIDNRGHVNAQVWNRTDWIAPHSVTTTIGTTYDVYKGYDVAFEGLSGDGFVVSADGTSRETYSIWDGTTWSGNLTAPEDPCLGATVWLRLASYPRSNYLGMVSMDANGDFCAQLWNGTDWYNYTLLDAAPTLITTQRFAVEFESQSSDLMVTWESSTAGVISYCEWDNATDTWCGAIASLADRGNANDWQELAADPVSDRLHLAAQQPSQRDLDAIAWNGENWGTWDSTDNSMNNDQHAFDIAFMGETGNVMIVYNDRNPDQPNYSICYGATDCQSGTFTNFINMTSNANNCGEARDLEYIVLDADPYSDNIMFSAETDNAHTKCAQEWDGQNWTTWHSNLGTGYSSRAVRDFHFIYNRYRDQIPPVIDFIPNTLTNNTVITDTSVLINVSTNDTYEVSSCFLEVDGVNQTMSITKTDGGKASCVSTVFGLGDSAHFFRVYTNDSSGNINYTDLRQIDVDLSAPTGSFIYVNPNPAELENENVTVNWTAADPHLNTTILNVTYPNGTLLGTYTTNFTLTTDNITAPGNYTVLLFANDSVGFTFETEVEIKVIDVAPPTIELTTPVNESFVSTDFLEFAYIPTDGFNVSQCNLTINSLINVTNTSILNGQENNFTVYDFEDGTHTWSVQCRDNDASSNTSETRSFDIDTSTPLIDFGKKTWANDSHFNMNFIYINVTVTESNEDNITFYLYNSTHLINATTLEEGNRTFNFTGITDLNEVYHYNVTVRDRASRQNTTETRYLTLDTIIPSVTLASPANDTFVTESGVNFFYTGVDSNLANCTVYTNATAQFLPNASNTTANSDVQGNISATLPDNVIEWNIRCFDRAGNAAFNTSNYSLVIDTTAPQVNFVPPTLGNDTHLNANTFTVAVSMSELTPSNLTYYLYNTTALVNATTVPSSTTTYTFTGIVDTNEPYTYNVTARDLAGNENTTGDRFITLDSTPPTINFSIRTEDNDSYFDRDYIFVNITAFDTNEANLTFYLYGEAANTKNATFRVAGTRSINFSFFTDTNERYTYNVSVQDKAGNENTTLPRVLTVDDTQPQITYAPATASNNSYLARNYIFIEITASDVNEANVTFYLYNTTHRLNASLRDAGVREINFTDLDPNEQYTYNVTISDLVNRKNTTKTRVITLDNTTPTVEFAVPTPANDTNQSSSSLVINVTHADTNPDTVTLDFNGTPTARTYSGTFTNFTLTSVGDGIYTYDVDIDDQANNANATETRTIRIDTLPPTVDLQTPTNDTWTVDPTILFTYVADDRTLSLENCSLMINDIVNSTNFTEEENQLQNFTLTFDSGRYNASVRCYDSVENVNETPAKVIKVDTTFPVIEDTLKNQSNVSILNNICLNVTVTDSFSNITLVQAQILTPSATTDTITLSDAATTTCDLVNGDNVYSFEYLTTQLGAFNWTKLIANDTAGNQNITDVGIFWNSSSVGSMTVNLSRPEVNIEVNESDVGTNYSYIHTCTTFCDASPQDCSDVWLKAEYNFSSTSDLNTTSVFLYSDSDAYECGTLTAGSGFCETNFTVTTTLDAGDLEFRVSCTANSTDVGTYFSDKRVNVSINDHPNATITTPQPSTVLNGVVVLNGSESIDDQSIQLYTWELDNNSLFDSPTVVCSDADANCSIDTAVQTQCVQESSNCFLRLNVTDSDNIQNATIIPIILDNVGPVVTIDLPANASNISANLTTVNATASDIVSSVDTLIFEYRANDTAVFTEICRNNTAPYQCQWNLTDVHDTRTYEIRVRANDSFNNFGNYSHRQNITINRTGPISTLTVPTTNANNSANPFTLNASIQTIVSPVHTVTFQYRNYTDSFVTACIDDDGAEPYSCSWDISSLKDGVTYQIKVFANDTTGNIGSQSNSTNLTFDQTAPTTLLMEPPTNSYTNATATFVYNTSDILRTVSSCSLVLNGTTNQTHSNIPENTVLNFTTNTTDNGDYLWQINCTDDLGTMGASSTRVIKVDTVAPTVSFTRPRVLENISFSPFEIQPVPTDGGGVGINATTIQYRENDSETWTFLCDNFSTTPICDWDTSSFIEARTYQIRARANDTFANLGEYVNVTNITIDRTSPLTTSLAPENNSQDLDGDGIVFSYNVTDTLLDIANCSLMINSSINVTNFTAPEDETTSLLVNDFANSHYAWQIQCVDTAGNINLSEERILVVAPDTDPPLVNLSSPSNNSISTLRDINFRYNVSDSFSGIEACNLYVNSTLNSTNSTAIVENQLNTFVVTDIANSDLRWYVNCTDDSLANNVGVSQEYTVRIQEASAVSGDVVLNKAVYETTINGGEIANITTNLTDAFGSPVSANVTLSIVRGNASTPWWSDSYPYRQRINVTNTHSDLLLPKTTINHTLDTSVLVTQGKMQTTGDDLRVVYFDNDTNILQELDRVIRDMNTVNTQVLFRTPGNVSNVSSNLDYYVYYGNSSVNDPPLNASEVYFYFDGFDTNTISSYDTTRGFDDSDEDGDGTLTFSSQTVRYTGTANQGKSIRKLETNLTLADAIIEVRQNIDSLPGGALHADFELGLRVNDTTYYAVVIPHENFFSASLVRYNSGSRTLLDTATLGDYALDEYHTVQFAVFDVNSTTTTLKVFVNGPEVWAYNDSSASRITDAGGFGTGSLQFRGNWDNLTVERYLDNVPITRNGSEEELIRTVLNETPGTGDTTYAFNTTGFNQTLYSAIALSEREGIYNNGRGFNTFTLAPDTTAPAIALVNPVTDFNTSLSTLDFNWTVSDNASAVMSCNITINNEINSSGLDVTRHRPFGDTISGLVGGSYLWNVTCQDWSNNTHTSVTRNITVLEAPDETVGGGVGGDNESVVLSWDAIAGADEYYVFRKDSFQDDFSSTPFATVSTPTYTDTDTAGDKVHFYKIASARGGANASTSKIIGKMSINLTYEPENSTDFHLFTLPLNISEYELNNGTNSAYNLEFTIPQCVHSIYRLNTTSGLFERTFNIEGNWTPDTGSESFTSLERGVGYWIELNQSCSLTVVGELPTEIFNISLDTGWNVQGWYSANETILPAAVNDPVWPINVSPEGSVAFIDRWNETLDRFEVTQYFAGFGYFPSGMNPDFLTLQPGRGYYFDVTSDAQWRVEPQND